MKRILIKSSGDLFHELYLRKNKKAEVLVSLTTTNKFDSLQNVMELVKNIKIGKDYWK